MQMPSSSRPTSEFAPLVKEVTDNLRHFLRSSREFMTRLESINNEHEGLLQEKYLECDFENANEFAGKTTKKKHKVVGAVPKDEVRDIKSRTVGVSGSKQSSEARHGNKKYSVIRNYHQ
ncbi:hypothetical protein HDU98_010214 [Podochytrium sp. JEL0797]|nr:hypothetical protein HDU98_010214 [Podochytrium sp. JEL0797]